MNVYIEAANELHAFFIKKQWCSCLIGGLANYRWGEVRAMVDVAFLLQIGFGNEKSFVDELLGMFEARITKAADFALENRIVLCRAPNCIGIDITLAKLPFESRIIDRASNFNFGQGMNWLTASAEDLVILKAFANRDQDWFDVKGILRRQWPKLDWGLITQELGELEELREDFSLTPRLNQVLAGVKLELPDEP